MKIVDYPAKIADCQGAISIKRRNHQNTEVLMNKLSNYKTLQLKQEMRLEKQDAKESARTRSA